MPVTTTIPTTAELRYTIPNHGNYRVGTITQRCTFTGYTPSMTVGENVPAGARVIMASMKSATTIPLLLGSSAAATAGQAGVALVWTVPTSITTSHSTNALLFLTAQSAFAAALPSNDSAINAWSGTPAATNDLILATTLNLGTTLQGTSARTFYLVPYAATTAAEAAQRFQVGTSTAATVATTGYCFGTSTSSTGSIDVQIVFEELVATPNT